MSLGSWQKPSSITQPTVDRLAQNNFSTVAIMSVTDEVPLTAFTYELYHSVSAIGKTFYFTTNILIVNLYFLSSFFINVHH